MDLTFLGGAAGFAGNLVNNAVQYYTQKNQQRQAQSNERKNMQLQSELEQQGYYNNIVRTPQALRDAGLNPAAATGMNIAAPSVSHSGNSQSVGLQANAAEIVNNAILGKSQVDLNEAAAKKANAEAKSTEIKNRRDNNEDKAVGSQLAMMLDEMKETTDNPFMRGFLESFLDANSGDMNIGTLEGFNKLWFDFTQKERDRELNHLQTEMDKAVLREQYSNGAAQALADMPRMTRLHMYTKILEMQANIGKLNAETGLTEEQKANLKASTAKLAQEVQSMLHHDPAAMYQAGDISSLLVSIGYDAIKGLATGVGFAVGARVAGKGAAASAGSSPASKLEAREVNLSRKQIHARDAAAAAAKRNAEAGAKYQEEKALRERLQRFRGRDYMR